MLQNTRSTRPLFLIFCIAILVLVVAAGLFAWYSLTRSATPPQATCGDVVFLQGRAQQPVSKDPQKVEQCFLRAYQQCAAQSIYVSEHGVDTGSSTTYWPQRQGINCQIIAQSSSFGMVGHNNPPVTITCQGVIPKNGGLLFQQCGTSGDIFLAG